MAQITLLSLPIGNLGDLTKRIHSILEGPGLFIVEDTRSFKNLLGHLGLSSDQKEIISYHDQSTQVTLDYIKTKILEAGHAYICSDAGSPFISDPAYPILKMAREIEAKISSCPGPSSLIMSLELSGFPVHPFTFYGFLPRSAEDRRNFLKDLESKAGTHIFFESPNRVRETFLLAGKELKNAQFCACREMTKKFESVYHFSQENYLDEIPKIPEKGEFVGLIHVIATSQGTSFGTELVEVAREVLKKKGQKKVLSKLLSQILDIPTKDIYKDLSNSDSES